MLLGGSALVAVPYAAAAQEGGMEEDGSYRLSPILIEAGTAADDDAGSVVASELWTGGKVATSILDPPASVSVVTQKEIEQRNADTVEDVLEYSSGLVTDYYGTDDRNDYYLVRGFQASTYRDGLTHQRLQGYNQMLPSRFRTRTCVDSARWLFQPTVGDILSAQGAGVASVLEPSGTDHQTFRKDVLKRV